MMLLALGLMSVQAESVCLLKSGCIRGTGIFYVYIYICTAVYMYIRTGRKSEHWCYKSK